MSVKLELYKVFKEVAEAGNITAAASALFISFEFLNLGESQKFRDHGYLPI